MKKSSMNVVIMLLIVTIIVAACGGQGKDEQTIDALSRDEAGSLKIAFTDEQSYYLQYGNAFNAMFPNVEVEVISTQSVWNSDDPVAEMKTLMDEQKPDVVSLTEAQYELLASEGSLYDLGTVIKQDQFTMDKLMPGAIDQLKTLGGGKLYGLSPSFSSQALFYNKDMFDKHKIPYPTDRMSWEELLQLAERFPTEGQGDEQTYGLVVSGNSAFDLVDTIGMAKGLTYVDYDAGQLSINTDEWSSIIETVTNSYKSGMISYPGGNTSSGGRMGLNGMIRRAGGGAFSINLGTMSFAAGKAAMTIDQSFLLNMLQMSERMGGAVQQRGAGSLSISAAPAGRSPILEIKEINWDLVTIPVDPTNPDVTGAFSLDTIWSIHAASKNLSPAWELVKYINGEQLAKTNSKSSPQLPTRTEFISNDEHNLEAFTVLGPNPVKYAQKFPTGFKDEFTTMASEELNQIISGAKSVADALSIIQTKGQDLLTQKKLSEQ